MFASDDADWVAGKDTPEPDADAVAPPTPMVVENVGKEASATEPVPVAEVHAISPRRKLLDEPVPDAAKLDAETLPPVLGIAFNTELTKKLSVTTESPAVQALARTTVVPVVAV